MYFEMKLREFVCPDCRRSFKSTSPNAARCSKCRKDWSEKRNWSINDAGMLQLKRKKVATCAQTVQAVEDSIVRGRG
jgi:tRNA(Ile2) C34 agmatinyltransferase TiaS